jgi:hypothetical protein
MSANRDEADSLLRQAFAEGVRWPIDRPSLKDLVSLGLTVPQIALYFSVDPVEVQALLKAADQAEHHSAGIHFSARKQ